MKPRIRRKLHGAARSEDKRVGRRVQSVAASAEFIAHAARETARADKNGAELARASEEIRELHAIVGSLRTQLDAALANVAREAEARRKSDEEWKSCLSVQEAERRSERAGLLDRQRELVSHVHALATALAAMTRPVPL
jgi:hypothetical protein